MSKLFETRPRFERESGDVSTHFVDEGREVFREPGTPGIARRVAENGSPRSPLRPPGIIQGELVVWYSQGLIQELSALVLGGYELSPWGGVEVGGVLFGTREPNGVHICSYRSLESEHQHGPSFELSARDLECLKRLLADARDDDNLKGLVPVGWYHSVSNREFCLTEHDIAVNYDFFPEPWQVAIVFKRSKKDPVVIGLFSREDNGFIIGQPQYTSTLDDLRAQHARAQTHQSQRRTLAQYRV